MARSVFRLSVVFIALVAVVLAAIYFAVPVLTQVDTLQSSGYHDHKKITNEAWFEREYIQVHHDDRVPNFGKNATVFTLRSGDWSDPTIWDTGVIPKQDATVVIKSDHQVTYDLVSDEKLTTVAVEGRLSFATNINTRLRVTHFLIYPTGVVKVGQREFPVKENVSAEIIINDAPIATSRDILGVFDPSQHGNGILVFGEFSVFGHDKGKPFVRLDREATKGASFLELSVPHEWEAGDSIFVADSSPPSVDTYLMSANVERDLDINAHAAGLDGWEILTLDSKSPSGVYLRAPLRFDHLGLDVDYDLGDQDIPLEPFLPHVANLTRNVIISSERSDGIRGHTVGFHGSKVNIQNALFKNLGRTTVDPIDNTVLNDQGQVVRLGLNQAARYALHMHHANFPTVSQLGDKPAFKMRRNVIVGAKRWGVSIHGSHFGLIEENIVIDAQGSGFVTEDGSETGNRFIGNFAAVIRGSGLKTDSRERGQGVGHEGSGFWLGSDNNFVENNVVSGVRASGFTLFRTESSKSLINIPGLSDGGPTRLFGFFNNEVYGAGGHGVRLWSTKECSVCKSRKVYIDKTRVWNSTHGLKFDYHSDYYVLRNSLLVGSLRPGSVGIRANHARTAEILNTVVLDMDVGVEAGGLRNRSFAMRDSVVVARTGLLILTPTSWGRKQNVTLANTLLKNPDDNPSQSLITFGKRDYGQRKEKSMLRRPVYLLDYQQDAGVDYQLFRNEQSPSYPLLMDSDPTMGCPEAGMTNAECWDKHKVSFGGEIASCDSRLFGIDGFVCPIFPGD